MTLEMILNLIAGVVFLSSAFLLGKKHDIINALIIIIGVILIAVALYTLVYVHVPPTSDGNFPTWFRIIGAFAPIGLVFISIAVFRLSSAARKTNGT